MIRRQLLNQACGYAATQQHTKMFVGIYYWTSTFEMVDDSDSISVDP